MTPRRVELTGLSKEQADAVVNDLRGQSDVLRVEVAPEPGGTFVVTAEYADVNSAEKSGIDDAESSDADSGDDEP